MDGTLVNIAIVPPHWLMQSSCMHCQPNVLPFSHSFVFLNSHFSTIPHLLYWTHAHEAITLHMHILIVITVINSEVDVMYEGTHFSKASATKVLYNQYPSKTTERQILAPTFYEMIINHKIYKWVQRNKQKQKQKQLAPTNPKYISIIILNRFN